MVSMVSRLFVVSVFNLRLIKLNLKKRLTIFTLFIVVITSGLVGVALIEIGFKNQIGQLEYELDSIRSTVQESDVDKVSLALALTGASRSNLSLYLVDNEREIYILEDKSGNTNQVQEIQRSLGGSDREKPANLLYKEVTIEGDLDLIIAASTISFNQERNSGLLRLLIYLSLSSLIALVVLNRVISQDLKRESVQITLAERLRNEELRRKLLMELASDTSHELRTPLTVIKGYVDLILRRGDNTIDDETLSKLSLESSRLDQNISSLLTMFELESLEDEALMPLNISDFLSSEVSLFQELDFDREIETNIEKDLWIKASEEIVLKLIRNVLVNCRKHSKKNASLRISLLENANEVILTFEDSGPLPEGQSLDINDYLTRFNGSRSLSKGGSGLGFSIISKSVSKLSGQLSLFHSELGGLGVSIKIPRLQTVVS